MGRYVSVNEVVADGYAVLAIAEYMDGLVAQGWSVVECSPRTQHRAELRQAHGQYLPELKVWVLPPEAGHLVAALAARKVA